MISAIAFGNIDLDGVQDKELIRKEGLRCGSMLGYELGTTLIPPFKSNVNYKYKRDTKYHRI